MSLYRSTVVGVAWITLGQIGTRIASLAGTLVIARLLAPQDYGLFALVLTLREVVAMVFSLGFDNYLVRSRTEDPDDYSTVWTLNLLQGGTVALVVAALARPLAGWLDMPHLDVALWCSIPAILLASAGNPWLVQYIREMRFQYGVIQAAAATGISLLVTIALALTWERNYLALIAGNFAFAVVSFVLSYVMHPGRPRPTLRNWRKPVSFGAWMSVSGMVMAVSTRFDVFILQRFAGEAAVGLFTMARDIVSTPVQQIVLSTSGALFSGLSSIQDDRARVKRAYFQSLAAIVTVLWPILLGMAAVAPALLPVLLGERWRPSIPLLIAIAPMVAVQMMAANTQAVVMLSDRLHLWMQRSLAYATVRLPFFLAGAWLGGLHGAVRGYVAAGLLLAAIDLTLVSRVLPVTRHDYFQIFLRPAVASVAMLVAALGMREIMPGETWLALLAAVVAGGLAYVATLMALWQAQGRPDGLEARALAMLQGLMATAVARAR